MIIPCYWVNEQLWRMTDKCLTSQFKTSDIGEVIVVDDGSPYKIDDLDHGMLIKLDKNGGYAKAVNAGLRVATGDYLIISNNDIEFVQPDWLDHLLKPLKEGYDISSIRTTDPDGWEVEDKITEGDKFGSLWAMKRDVYTKLGPLDEGYGKGYFEDLDYQRRAEQEGFRIAKNHAGLVEHLGKATFKIVDPEDRSYHEAAGRFIQKWTPHKL